MPGEHYQNRKVEMKVLALIFLFFVTTIFSSKPVFGQAISDPKTRQTDLCDFTALIGQATDDDDSLLRAGLYLRALGVLAELKAYRSQFLLAGSLINLFPTAYYHVTLEEINKIGMGNYCYPVERLQQMLVFYNAYKVNRNAWDAGNVSAVESHWINHFRFADHSKISFFCCKASVVLASGIDAHIKYDLPRALRFAFSLSPTTPDLLFDEFKSCNCLFESALVKTVRDINHLNTCGRMMEILNDNCTDRQIHSVADFCCYPFDKRQHVYIASDVINFRMTAWNQAISDSVLMDFYGKALPPQPLMDSYNFSINGQIIGR